MKRKSKSNNNLLSPNDICYEEGTAETISWELPITGKPVAQFNFSDNSSIKDEPMLMAEPKLKTPLPLPDLNTSSDDSTSKETNPWNTPYLWLS